MDVNAPLMPPKPLMVSDYCYHYSKVAYQAVIMGMAVWILCTGGTLPIHIVWLVISGYHWCDFFSDKKNFFNIALFLVLSCSLLLGMCTLLTDVLSHHVVTLLIGCGAVLSLLASSCRSTSLLMDKPVNTEKSKITLKTIFGRFVVATGEITIIVFVIITALNLFTLPSFLSLPLPYFMLKMLTMCAITLCNDSAHPFNFYQQWYDAKWFGKMLIILSLCMLGITLGCSISAIIMPQICVLAVTATCSFAVWLLCDISFMLLRYFNEFAINESVIKIAYSDCTQYQFSSS
jgi:hypothetical protein